MLRYTIIGVTAQELAISAYPNRLNVRSGSDVVTAANCIGCEYATVCVRGAYVALVSRWDAV
jgi:hypothetical protein